MRDASGNKISAQEDVSLLTIEHPVWCEPRRGCTVTHDIRTPFMPSGYHVGGPSVVAATVLGGTIIEVAVAQFQDNRGTEAILDAEPEIRLRVIDDSSIDQIMDSYLTVDQAKELVAALQQQIQARDAIKAGSILV